MVEVVVAAVVVCVGGGLTATAGAASASGPLTHCPRAEGCPRGCGPPGTGH